MDNKLKEKKSKKTTIILSSLILIAIIYIIGNTYAAIENGYKIVFNRAEGTEVMKTCYTDEFGKLDEDCLSAISDVCNKWSKTIYTGSNIQSYPNTINDLRNTTFTEDKNFYCVAGSSSSGYDKGCYICDNNSNIMKWKFNSDADDDCSSGYYKDTSINESNCVSIVPDSCYICKSDSNIMKWDNNGDADSSCSSGYKEDTSINQTNCATIATDSCYICKSDSNIMKWDNNGDADSSCSSGYKEDTSINQTNCKTITPSYCYVCRNNSNIMKWDTDPSSDANCSSGYTPVAKSEKECVPVENPKTGNILIFFVWILGIFSICYSIYYFKKQIKIKD